MGRPGGVTTVVLDWHRPRRLAYSPAPTPRPTLDGGGTSTTLVWAPAATAAKKAGEGRRARGGRSGVALLIRDTSAGRTGERYDLCLLETDLFAPPSKVSIAAIAQSTTSLTVGMGVDGVPTISAVTVGDVGPVPEALLALTEHR